jgi:excisionase family DNA binding protein
MSKKMYTTSEAAKILGLSPATVAAYCSEGKMPAMKSGGRYRISAKALQDWAISTKRQFKHKAKDGNTYNVEICSLAQPGEPRPSFFYVFTDDENAFFIELMIGSDFSQGEAVDLKDVLGFVNRAIDSNIREPKRIIVRRDGIAYEDLVPDMESF